MFSKSETAHLKKEFWTTLGRLLKPHPSADGKQINWINYKTDVRDIYFRMEASNKLATIAIDITHRDHEMQLLFFEQFEQLKNYLHDIMGEEWTWDKKYFNEYGHQSARIYTTIENKNYFVKENWSDLFSFFKGNMIKLDEFWTDAKETFIELSK